MDEARNGVNDPPDLQLVHGGRSLDDRQPREPLVDDELERIYRRRLALRLVFIGLAVILALAFASGR